MKRLVLIFCLSIPIIFTGQNKEQYAYDAPGNRKSRNVCTGCRQVYQAPTYEKDSMVAAKIVAEEGIAVFPNPTPAGVSVKIGNFKTEEGAKLLVMDASGKIMISQEATSQQTELDFSKLMQGIYYVRVIKGSKDVVYKVIKVQ